MNFRLDEHVKRAVVPENLLNSIDIGRSLYLEIILLENYIFLWRHYKTPFHLLVVYINL